MFGIIELEECLAEKPAINFWQSRSKRKVTDPVRIEDGIWIFDDISQLAGPVGVVHPVHYPDGKTREVFTWWSGSPRDFSDSVFLKPGRAGDKKKEILGLIIDDPSDQVPDTLKDNLRTFDKTRGWRVVEQAAVLRS